MKEEQILGSMAAAIAASLIGKQERDILRMSEEDKVKAANKITGLAVEMALQIQTLVNFHIDLQSVEEPDYVEKFD